MQELFLAGSIAGLAAALVVAVVFAHTLSTRDRKQLRESLDWHDESLAEMPPTMLAPPSDGDADRPPLAA
jgi:hypothetical protein